MHAVLATLIQLTIINLPTKCHKVAYPGIGVFSFGWAQRIRQKICSLWCLCRCVLSQSYGYCNYCMVSVIGFDVETSCMFTQSKCLRAVCLIMWNKATLGWLYIRCLYINPGHSQQQHAACLSKFYIANIVLWVLQSRLYRIKGIISQQELKDNPFSSKPAALFSDYTEEAVVYILNWTI